MTIVSKPCDLKTLLFLLQQI